MSKTKSIVILIITSLLVVIVALACFLSFNVPNSIYKYNSILSKVGQGIDISGGYYVVLTPEISSERSNDGDVLSDAMEILRTRLDDKGYTEANISVQDSDKIRVEVPQVENAEEVLAIIGQTGELTFKDSTGKVWLNGEDHIESAYVSFSQEIGKYVVVLNFTASGANRFSEATAAISQMENKTFNIYLGDTAVSTPTVNQQITSATAQIESYETYEDAQNIAAVIDSGKLPINYQVSEARSISSKLGNNTIKNSVVAMAIGLFIIFIVMAILYKGMGLASSMALVIYALLYVIFLAIIPNVQLTLPGIAGILLSIGMAVDANIVIFESIKEEYKLGKTVNASIKQGSRRAFVTVLDSNITTILASIVLWILCPGTIKGFAITLLIGIVLSMFTAILVTQWILSMLRPLASNQEKFLNLKREGGNLDD